MGPTGPWGADVASAIPAVEEYLRRCGEGDPAIADLFAEDALFFDCAGPTEVRGREEIRERVFAELYTGVPDFHCAQIVHIAEVGNVGLAELVLAGTHLGPLWGNEPTGAAVRWHTAGTWEVGPDGLFTREAYYYDPASLFAQLAGQAAGISEGETP